MFQLQIFVVLLSLFLAYSLVSKFNLFNLVEDTCYRYDNYQLASKQSRAGNHHLASNQSRAGNHHLTSKQSSCKHGPSYCGNTSAINLKCPFRFEGNHPNSCSGSPYYFELSCDKRNRTVMLMNSYIHKQYVYVELDSIDYDKQTIHVIDPGLKKYNCSALPLYSFSDISHLETGYLLMEVDQDMDVLIFVSCKNPVRSKSPLYVDTTACNITEKQFSNVKAPSNYSYVIVGENLVVSDIEESCTIYKVVPAQLQCLPNIRGGNISFGDVHNMLANGFKLTWSYRSSRRRIFFCRLAVPITISLSYLYYALTFGTGLNYLGWTLVLAITARSVIGIIALLAFLIYKWHRRHLSKYDNIEEFLQTSNNFMPIRYSYKEVKAITKNFKEKLGEGGYGLVYKGKLRSGSLVAVKMLNKSKANGQEFINEVATIGRIHHVNVVRLVGFCVTASKRAVVYDYMPNGSLDKFIFSECPNGDPLDWKKSYEIAKGVARGIEYLHQGCNMQILHFDIKPHNILLDESFVPKVSDFGLAKLHPIQNGYLPTLTAARGTLGYMAPELLYKKIGRVSYKADVYSYGMLLMEMAGRRKNVNAHAEHSSQIYFPSWIYDKFEKCENMEIGDHIAEEGKGIARKLVLIALWCIQMKPEDRPSMREVLEMLENDLQCLPLPPKPLFYPPDSPVNTQRSSHSSEDSTESPCYSSVYQTEHIDVDE